MVSASSTSSVGGSSVIDRKTAAGVVLTVIIGSWTVSVSTSSSRDLPHRFAGPTTARRGACCQAGCRCVAATHNVTASSASGAGQDHEPGDLRTQFVQQLGAGVGSASGGLRPARRSGSSGWIGRTALGAAAAPSACAAARWAPAGRGRPCGQAARAGSGSGSGFEVALGSSFSGGVGLAPRHQVDVHLARQGSSGPRRWRAGGFSFLGRAREDHGQYVDARAQSSGSASAQRRSACYAPRAHAASPSRACSSAVTTRYALPSRSTRHGYWPRLASSYPLLRPRPRARLRSPGQRPREEPAVRPGSFPSPTRWSRSRHVALRSRTEPRRTRHHVRLQALRYQHGAS